QGAETARDSSLSSFQGGKKSQFPALIRVAFPRAKPVVSAPSRAGFLAIDRFPAAGSRISPMDSFEFNKIAGAVLGTALGVMALSIVSEAIFTAPAPAQPGFEIEVAEAEAGPADSGAAA